MINLSEVKASLAGGFYLLVAVAAVIFLPDNTDFRQNIYDLEVPPGATGQEVIRELNEGGAIHNTLSLVAAARLLGFHQTLVHPGLYQIRKGWNNRRLLKHLKTAPLPAVKVVIRPFQMRHNTLKAVCKDLDIKYTALQDQLQDQQFLQGWGPFTTENIYCIFFSDTMLIRPDSRAREVADRLVRNYLNFWTPDKLEQAAALGLTAPEVGILASIVYAETKVAAEMPIIAGIYLNRLDQEMRLQADPTVVFAAGRPLSRVLRAHKRIRSDYNTYKVGGLPPGPVFTPTIQAIEAVLSAQNHDYLYFCARFDLSGYHYFSRTYEEHQRVAKRYQRELNKRKIGFRGS